MDYIAICLPVTNDKNQFPFANVKSIHFEDVKFQMI